MLCVATWPDPSPATRSSPSPEPRARVVSFEHQSAIRKLELALATKSVLTWAAWHACRGCGIAFAGVPTLVMETGASERAVRRALEDLRQRGLIVTQGYATGGRGRATEYLVAPDILPCPRGRCKTCGRDTSVQGKSVSRGTQTLPPRQGNTPDTLPPRQGIEPDTLPSRSVNPATQSVNPATVAPQQSVSLNRQNTIGPSASLRADPPGQDFDNPNGPPPSHSQTETPESVETSRVAHEAAESFMRRLTGD